MNSESSSGTSVSETPDALVTSNHLVCGPLLGGISALTGGLLTWCVVLIFFPVFTLPPELADLPSPVPWELGVKQDAATAEAAKQNVTLALAIFGLFVAFLLTAAEAFRRHVFLSIWWRGILAAFVAVSIGAGAGILGATVSETLAKTTDLSPLMKTIVMQAAMLGMAGMGIGIGVGVSFGRILLVVGGAAGGALGGALAAILYPVVVGYLLPNLQTERVMPNEPMSSLMWLVIAAVMIGIVLGGLGSAKK